MNEPQDAPPGEPARGCGAGRAGLDAGWERERRRGALLIRLGALLGVAWIAFGLTTRLLVRTPLFSRPSRADVAAGVVRAQFAALGRGDLRGAYDLFSGHYRQEVPFGVFRDLVVTHWWLFRAPKISIEREEESAVRVVVYTHVVSADGQRYLACYTLVLVEGEWQIDDMRWRREPVVRRRYAARQMPGSTG